MRIFQEHNDDEVSPDGNAEWPSRTGLEKWSDPDATGRTETINEGKMTIKTCKMLNYRVEKPTGYRVRRGEPV